jgi:hypothetical protein
MRAPPETTLGTRFLLIVLLVAVIPLGLTGAWLGRDAGRTGEALLEQRMVRSLDGLAREMGEAFRVRGVRLDSGDLGALAVESRIVLHRGVVRPGNGEQCRECGTQRHLTTSPPHLVAGSTGARRSRFLYP